MSSYIVRRTTIWPSNVTSTIVDECSTIEEAFDLMATYCKEDLALVNADWSYVKGFRITVDEKWDNGDTKTIKCARWDSYLKEVQR